MEKVANLFNCISVPLWAVFVVCCVGQVVGRYFLDIPLQWTEEIARVSLIWLTFIGAVQLAVSDDHIEIGYLRQLGIRPLIFVIEITKAIAMFITGGFLAFGGAKLLPMTINSHAPGSGLSLAAWYVVAVAAGFMLMFIATLALPKAIFRSNP
ncbi:TRAP transporter small permease subunit (plasmid) [Pseudohalocynthiibacter aestuariivivens]|nr:TRAP transporter small permease subunit [Pseudohalocynthiibacter aestuariivivens]QIE48023.1 TRAP transporter small permease subunit [Pseudohalocynthiibacter aestuariivivens]